MHTETGSAGSTRFVDLLTGMCEAGSKVGIIAGDEETEAQLTAEFSKTDLEVVGKDCADTIIVYDYVREHKERNLIEILDKNFIYNNAVKMYFIFSPLFLLSNSSNSEILRRALLDKNLVETSLVFPKNIDSNLPNDYKVLLVLNKVNREPMLQNNDTMVSFIDSRQIDIQMIHQLFSEGKYEELRNLLKKEIFDNNISIEKMDYRDIIVRGEKLHALEHCRPIKQKIAIKLLNNMNTCEAKGHFDIIRSSLLQYIDKNEESNDGLVELNCISFSEFKTFGYSYPNNIDVKKYEKTKGWEQFLLQPNDILLSVRGKVGQCCIISPDYSGDNYIASNVCAIFRKKNKSHYDPRILFMYFHSQIFAEFLASIIMPVAMPRVNINSLSKMNIPLIDNKQQNIIINNFNELNTMAKNLVELEKKCNALYDATWSLKTDLVTF